MTAIWLQKGLEAAGRMTSGMMGEIRSEVVVAGGDGSGGFRRPYQITPMSAAAPRTSSSLRGQTSAAAVARRAMAAVKASFTPVLKKRTRATATMAIMAALTPT